MPTQIIPPDISGGAIQINNEGAIFLEPASDHQKFESKIGNPTDFLIKVNESNSGLGRVEISSDLKANITIQPNVVLDNPVIRAKTCLSTTAVIGDTVTLDEFEGSNKGSGNIVIGENFTTNNDVKTNNGKEKETVKIKANFDAADKIDTDGGNDTVVTPVLLPRSAMPSPFLSRTELRTDEIGGWDAGDHLIASGADNDAAFDGNGDDALEGGEKLGRDQR